MSEPTRIHQDSSSAGFDGRRKYVSVAEASEHLGIGRSTVYDLITSGKLKAKKFGRRTMIHVDALARFERESDWS